MYRNKRKQDDHKCGEWRCGCCGVYTDNEDHLCSLQQEARRESASKYIFYDFECVQEGGLHTPNLCVAHTCCAKCIDEEDVSKPCICGSRCSTCYSWSKKKREHTSLPCSGCGRREVVFKGRETLQTFCQWLFDPEHAYNTAIAHNAKGYDSLFLQQYLVKTGLKHDVIYAGSKMMYGFVKNKLSIRLIDSLNFLTMSLDKLPETFGIEGERKGYFPHFFNTFSVEGYRGPYPDAKYYGFEFKKAEAKTAFDLWYKGMEGKTFDFDEEILAYCQSDVRILRLACLRFRKMLMNVTAPKDTNGTEEDGACDDGPRDGASPGLGQLDADGEKSTKKGGIDPFRHLTLASVCMHTYKSCFYKPMHVQNEGEVPAEEEGDPKKVYPIGQVPAAGYVKHQEFSKKSIQWLEFLMETARQTGKSLNIRHALNHPQGEYKIPGTLYKADGYCEKTRTIFFFHGSV